VLGCGTVRSIQRATVYNVSKFFGWITNVEDVATALRGAAVQKVS
jgi:hypothetical protein